jgi:hypothetical protein
MPRKSSAAVALSTTSTAARLRPAISTRTREALAAAFETEPKGHRPLWLRQGCSTAGGLSLAPA